MYTRSKLCTHLTCLKARGDSVPSSPPTATTLPSLFNRWAKARRVVKEGSRLQVEGREGDHEWQAPVTWQNTQYYQLKRKQFCHICTATSIQLVPPHTRTLPCFEVELGGNQMTLAPKTLLYMMMMMNRCWYRWSPGIGGQ